MPTCDDPESYDNGYTHMKAGDHDYPYWNDESNFPHESLTRNSIVHCQYFNEDSDDEYSDRHQE